MPVCFIVGGLFFCHDLQRKRGDPDGRAGSPLGAMRHSTNYGRVRLCRSYSKRQGSDAASLCSSDRGAVSVSRWIAWNPSPTGRNVGDCAIRAVARALRTDWETAYALVALNGYLMGDMPSSNAVWGAVLRQHGFYRYAIPNTCPDCYSFADFAEDHPHGIYVLGTGTHVATVEDGTIYDSWDSSAEIPVYYWTKEAN